VTLVSINCGGRDPIVASHPCYSVLALCKALWIGFVCARFSQDRNVTATVQREDRTDLSASSRISRSLETKRRMQNRLITLLCVCVLVGILTAGLWPFHSPKNDVSWLDHGLHFGRHGLILSSETLTLTRPKDRVSCSIEMLLHPERIDSGGTLLGFFSPGNRIVTFSLHQSLDDLFLQRTRLDGQRAVKTKWYVEHVFHKNKQVIATITSSPRGTAVYVNGGFVGASPGFGLSINELTGQLVVGNHPLVDNGWQGQLRGLAIYSRDLTPTEVVQHYAAWTINEQAEIKNENPSILYLFNEGTGEIVHDQMNSANDLHIPERYFVLRAPFLELPWEEFKPHWGYYKNVLINIGGFIPLGFFFCAYFSLVRRLDRSVLATVVLGGVVSLGIEVSQAFLPTRDSGVTDIITNTLGTGVGVILYRCQSLQALFTTIGVRGDP
jgi:VanZ like family/Concanavalin A-like lectin/glucanases superfamily